MTSNTSPNLNSNFASNLADSFSNISSINHLTSKIPVAILGATGMVGQKYIELLENHPMFEVVCVAASSNSAGKVFGDLMASKWQLSTHLPKPLENLIIEDVQNIDSIASKCRLVFSCFEIEDKELIMRIEFDYARCGVVVVSNASANRSNPLVPMLIPEVNIDHLDLIPFQQEKYNLPKSGFVVVKPNCSIQSFVIPIFALNAAGYSVNRILVTTLQAVSGGGYPGVPSLDVIDNIVPFIGGEESKTETEPIKILSKIENGTLTPIDMRISATCTRVPVIDGHTASVSIGFQGNIPYMDEIIEIWQNFEPSLGVNKLPMLPSKSIRYMSEPNRPQPRKDRDFDKAMTCSVGRLRKCNILDYKFVGLSHNTVRGAAGGGILNAEVLVARGLV